MKSWKEKHGTAWRVRYRRKGGAKVTVKSGLTKKQADKLVKKTDRTLSKGGRIMGAGVSFKALQQKINELLRPQITDEYFVLIERSLRLLEGSAGGRLSSVDAHAIDNMVAGLLKKGSKPSTVNKYLRHAKAGLQKAVEWGMVPANPMAGVHMLPVPETTVRTINHAEEEDLLASGRNLRDRCLIYLALYAGLRAKEIANLNVKEDLITEERKGQPTVLAVHVRNRQGRITKDKKERTSYTKDATAIGQLTHLARSRKGWGHYPFYNGNARSVSQRFRHIRKNTTVKCKLHDLRRTFDTRCLIAGIPVAVVAKMSGHSIKVMQEFYARISDNDALEAVRSL